jgi:hypothetical protein
MQDAKPGNNRAVTAGQCLGPERHDGELLAETPAELRGCRNISWGHSRCARSMTRRANRSSGLRIGGDVSAFGL